MARKSAVLLPSRQKHALERSWAAVGIDTSMSSIAVVGFGYDAMCDKVTEARYAEIRWVEEDYFERLRQASLSYKLVMSVIGSLWLIPSANVNIAIEEPFHFGAVKRQVGGWIKQQSEVSGAVKASLLRFGYTSIYEIGNSQWRAALRREGVTITTGEQGKWDIKDWAIQGFGLPDLPDLVRGKHGGKIPRPETGRGANAKAEQPNDIYDAAGCCCWMAEAIENGGVQ